MYRINLYREFAVRRLERRRQMVRIGLLSGILGVQLLLIVTLILSSHLLGERVEGLRGDVARLEAEVQGHSADHSRFDLATARQVLVRRRDRVDWYPKLVGLSQSIDPSLTLEAIYSLPADPARPARLEIRGCSPRAGGDVNAVFRFVDELRREPGYAAAFSAIRLGTIEGAEANRFEVVCEAPEQTGAIDGDVAGGTP
jgi:hypothetical protein